MKTVLTVKVASFMLTVMSMMDSGPMIKLMVLEFISMSMVLNMKESGKMIYNMERELRHGQTVHVMKEIMLMDASMV